MSMSKSKRLLKNAVFLTAMVGIGGLVGWFSVGREFLTFGVETDYLGGFMNEARNILHGRPLDVKFHPPLYPATIAVVQLLTGDWVLTGLAVSWIASLVVVYTQFEFFRILDGFVAGIGVIIALACSEVFLTYSATASSDVFSFALYSATLLLLIKAVTSESLALWALSGISMGLALLSRSNAIALLIMSVAPWMCAEEARDRTRNIGWFLAGFALPLLTWLLIASYTGSPIWPQKNYTNIAMTFFGGGGFSGDTRVAMGEKFSGLADVLSHDPVYLIRQYILNSAGSFRSLFTPDKITALPVVSFALPGILLLFFTNFTPFAVLYILTTISYFFVVCLMEFSGRFFMFIVPLFGAAFGVLYVNILDYAKSRRLKYTIHFAILSLLIFSFTLSITDILDKLHAQDEELSTVSEKVKPRLPPGASLIARKPHVPFYAHANSIGFPRVENLDGLRAYLKDLDLSEPTFLYYGSAEASHRPELSELKEGKVQLRWLELVAEGSAPVAWALYRVNPEALGNESSD